jgi:polyhydroxybutyrate depolymerase
VDDVGFVRAIAASLQAQVNIDARRIYATGLSNGAILSQRLACEAADLFAAVAPVAGTLNFSPCQPSGKISVIEFHGTADQHIPYSQPSRFPLRN